MAWKKRMARASSRSSAFRGTVSGITVTATSAGHWCGRFGAARRHAVCGRAADRLAVVNDAQCAPAVTVVSWSMGVKNNDSAACVVPATFGSAYCDSRRRPRTSTFEFRSNNTMVSSQFG
jgi:hypothetical protein